MKKLINSIKKIIPAYMIIPLVATLAANQLAYNGSRLFTQHMFHFDLTTRFEDMIPLVPWHMLFYYGAFAFWAANYIIGSRQDKNEAYRFVSADFFAKMICLIVFIAFPTTNVRPELQGTGFWVQTVRFLYTIDAADNLFPSIHCMCSWFCVIAVRNNPAVKKWYKLFSYAFAAAICISTLTLKQHVFIDIVGGIGLAEFSYWFVRDTGFVDLYRRVVERQRAQIRKWGITL